ncbi:hypothetical protein CEP54_014259 [Fusarium duplospermum]|uniref:Uncharacterized protein n=1 Tax=Fusarium duplospermum TaxID=1325734 RepID=A0A428NXH2_9HYPO|nr:hypothetical protein CEP54_014259 [Fusarium duplospermum]
MVNTRRKCYGNAPQPRKRPPKRRDQRSAGLSTTYSSQRLPLRFPTMPSRPSPSPSNDGVTWLLLETLNAHQAATQRPINPEGDIKNLEQLGTSGFILTLLEDAESTLPSPSKSTLTPQQRVERIQAHCGLEECPQNEQPKPKTSTALIEPQSYNQPSTDYKNQDLREFPADVLFLVSRMFVPVSWGATSIPEMTPPSYLHPLVFFLQR